MTSPRRRPGRPIESVSLRITFKGGTNELAKVMEAMPSAVLRKGVCEVEIEAEGPAEVAEKAKAVLEKLQMIARP
jgi:hypothetical protein